jgi:hypothetical protein
MGALAAAVGLAMGAEAPAALAIGVVGVIASMVGFSLLAHTVFSGAVAGVESRFPAPDAARPPAQPSRRKT